MKRTRYGRTIGKVIAQSVLAVAAMAGISASVFAVACWKDDGVPCNNAPTRTKACTCTHSDGSTYTCSKDQTFNITTTCSVQGSVQVAAGESGRSNQAGSTSKSCSVQGNWPDCDGNSEGTITQSVSCNTAQVDLTSATCKG